jgi:hypothetical protein
MRNKEKLRRIKNYSVSERIFAQSFIDCLSTRSKKQNYKKGLRELAYVFLYGKASLF